jgi:CIC family chloride channel protein
MGTAFAGIVRAPLTSVIMIFELTRDYSIIVPLMLSNLIAFFISHRMQPLPIYETLLRQDGIHLPSRELKASEGRLQVISAMRPVPGTLSARSTAADALARLGESALDAWPVTDEGGLCGMLHRAELELAVTQGRGDQKLGDLLQARDPPSHLHPDHELTLALERLGSRPMLPVVSRSNARELLGVITLRDILESYGIAPAAGEGGARERRG